MADIISDGLIPNINEKTIENIIDSNEITIEDKTKFIEITNDLGELCTVEIDFDNPHFETARKIKITRIADRIYNIPIRKGESVRIYPKNTNPSFTVGPIAHKHSNFFGDNN